MILLLLLLLPSVLFGECSTAEAIKTVRPGAEWVMTDDSYAKLVWMDRNQSKPTEADVAQAKTGCEMARIEMETRKQSAKIVLLDETKSVDLRLKALIEYLDIR